MMTKAEILMELGNMFHNSADTDNVDLLHDIMELAVYERVVYAESTSDLLTSIYTDIIEKANATEYVQDNYDIDDVYSDYEIINYATEFSIDSVYNDDEIIDYVSNNFKCTDVFDGDDIIDCVTDTYEIDYVYSCVDIREKATCLYTLEELSEDYSNDSINEFISNYMIDNRYNILSWIDDDAIIQHVKDNINLNDYLKD